MKLLYRIYHRDEKTAVNKKDIKRTWKKNVCGAACLQLFQHYSLVLNSRRWTLCFTFKPMQLLAIIRLIRATQMLTMIQIQVRFFLYQTMHLFWPQGKSGQWLVQPVTFRSSLRECVKLSVQRNTFSFPDKLLRMTATSFLSLSLLLSLSVSLFLIPQLLFILSQRGESAPSLWLMKKVKPLSLIGKLPVKQIFFTTSFHNKLLDRFHPLQSPQNSKARRGTGHEGTYSSQKHWA